MEVERRSKRVKMIVYSCHICISVTHASMGHSNIDPSETNVTYAPIDEQNRATGNRHTKVTAGATNPAAAPRGSSALKYASFHADPHISPNPP